MPSSTASTRSYSLIEPHPSAKPRAYLATGRGGAGNYSPAPLNLTPGPDARGPAFRTSIHNPSVSSSTLSSSRSANFYSGRGGAGNVRPSNERAIFSFDEELERQMSQERKAAPVYHVGRGGAGNVTAGTTAWPKTVSSRRSGSESEGDSRSERSVGSVESGADVATRKVRMGWKKMMGQ
jgi:hypothetical protein